MNEQDEIDLELMRQAREATQSLAVTVAETPQPRKRILLPITDDLKELARAATPAAIQALCDVLESDSAPFASKVAAANAILDRAHGKPHQSSTVQGGVTFNIISAIPSPPNSRVIDHEPTKH